MSKKVTQKRVKVLYQNLNGIWYAFAENGQEVYFGRVPVKASTAGKADREAPKAPRRRAPSKSAA